MARCLVGLTGRIMSEGEYSAATQLNFLTLSLKPISGQQIGASGASISVHLFACVVPVTGGRLAAKASTAKGAMLEVLRQMFRRSVKAMVVACVVHTTQGNTVVFGHFGKDAPTFLFNMNG